MDARATLNENSQQPKSDRPLLPEPVTQSIRYALPRRAANGHWLHTIKLYFFACCEPVGTFFAEFLFGTLLVFRNFVIV